MKASQFADIYRDRINRVIVYPKAKHSFTNPDADKAGVEGLAYDADADKKSWDELVKFFKQVFGK